MDVKPKQVLIEATIVETNFDITNILGSNPSNIVTSGSSSSSSIFNLKTLGYAFPITSLENNSNINILANPQILVTNHNTASINTGNEIGYSTITVTETSTVESINFLTTGITLEITPHISENNEILMEIKPSISEGQVSNNKPMEYKYINQYTGYHSRRRNHCNWWPNPKETYQNKCKNSNS